MKPLRSSELATVMGGVFRAQSGEAYDKMCTGADALDHYTWALENMTPNESEAPGVKRRAIEAWGNLCKWPTPS